jgi:beta-galactosidase
MYFGVDYYPEHWVYPYGGTLENPEAEWEHDIELMLSAGVNVVRMGEFSWGLCETEPGKYDFSWLARVMDLMAKAGIKVVLGTPTAAPPIWLAIQHPEILPIDEQGAVLAEGTRRATCMNSNAYWDACKNIVTAMAKSLGKHPNLIAWQIDNGLGAHLTEESFNEETRRDWHAWLQTKYETIQRYNELTGSSHWGQTVTKWEQIPMPRKAPTLHNPALVVDWRRFCSDTIVAFVRMQADLLHELSPDRPVTSNLRALQRKFDHFDVAEVLDFVAVDSNVAIKSKCTELACDLDMMRSLKKTDIKTPDGDEGFWVIEQKAGQVNWHDVNSLVRPQMVRLFTYQLISRGASGVLFFRWRQPRIGTEKFYGAVLPHNGRKDSRTYREISVLGDEIKLLAPALSGTKVTADVCILFSHENDWAMRQPMQPNKHFELRNHIQLFYNAFHSRNITVDFARPTEDLSKYKLVIAPSLHLMAGGEADLLKLYVQKGGTLVSTFNTGLVDEHHMAPVNGYPHDLTDLFGLEVLEFDPLPPGEENHMTFKGAFTTSHMHPARMWCDIIEPKGCTVLATYTKDFYSGKPAVTMNSFGLGKAVYVGTMSHQPFYEDLVVWLRQSCGLNPLLKVPDTIEVCMRHKEGVNIYFLLNHQNTPVRIQFYKAMHDCLTGSMVAGTYDLPAHGVLVLDEHRDAMLKAAENVASGIPA